MQPDFSQRMRKRIQYRRRKNEEQE